MHDLVNFLYLDELLLPTEFELMTKSENTEELVFDKSVLMIKILNHFFPEFP